MPIEPIKRDFEFKIHLKTGRCNLEIHPKDEGRVTVVLTELADNPGPSITNVFEQIATQVYHQFLSETPISDIIWIEHYDKDSYRHTQDGEETFDQVALSWDLQKQQFYNPQWQAYSKRTEKLGRHLIPFFSKD